MEYREVIDNQIELQEQEEMAIANEALFAKKMAGAAAKGSGKKISSKKRAGVKSATKKKNLLSNSVAINDNNLMSSVGG